MRLKFLELPSDERRVYIEQAAARRNVQPVILEKDFWVCWIRAVLFESRFGDVLVFKGGTSLSKVFGVIDRFSEDIDLSLARRGFALSTISISWPSRVSKRIKRSLEKFAKRPFSRADTFVLVDAHQGCGLCEAALLDDPTNAAGELCLRELFFRLRKTDPRAVLFQSKLFT